MYDLQAQHAEAEASKAARAEDRARWMDGLLDKENQMNIGHVLLFSLLIWVTIWALFGWAGVFIFAALCIGGFAAVFRIGADQ